MLQVRLTTAPDGRIELESPYDADLVTGLKTINYSLREWDGSRKRWLFSTLAELALLEVLRQCHAHIDDKRQAEVAPAAVPVTVPAMPADLRDAFDTLCCAYQAPFCVLEAAYRALSKYKHPDMDGGSHEEFVQINSAMDTVRRYFTEV